MDETVRIQESLAAQRATEDLPWSEQLGEAHSTSGSEPEPIALDDNYSAVLRTLLTRSAWTDGELRVLASRFGVMPWAAVEKLNRWALDRFGDLLLEGEDRVTVNEIIKAQILT
jgi:hypothetical protein